MLLSHSYTDLFRCAIFSHQIPFHFVTSHLSARTLIFQRTRKLSTLKRVTLRLICLRLYEYTCMCVPVYEWAWVFRVPNVKSEGLSRGAFYLFSDCWLSLSGTMMTTAAMLALGQMGSQRVGTRTMHGTFFRHLCPRWSCCKTNGRKSG